jgi:autotransporter-associated beta strand protein
MAAGAAVTGLAAASPAKAQGVQGTWIGTTSNWLWSTPTNWASSIIPGLSGGPDDVASFVGSSGVAATSSVNVDVTLGAINFDWAGGVTIIGAKQMTLGSPNGNATINATASNGANAYTLRTVHVAMASDVDVTVAGGATLDLESPVSETGGSHTITFYGSGLSKIGGGNTYTGATRVFGGTVSLLYTHVGGDLIVGNPAGGSAALVQINGSGTVAATSNVVLNPTGVFDSGGGYVAVASLAGSGTLKLSPGGNFAVSGSASTTFAGKITGQGVLTKSGAGSLTLTGASDFNPNGEWWSELDAGTLVLGHDQCLGGGRLSIVDDVGTAAVSSAGMRSITNGVSVTHLARFTGTDPMAFGGLTAGTGTGTTNVTLTVDGGATLSFTNVASATGGGGMMTKAGAGTLTLGSPGRACDFTGTYNVTGGMLRMYTAGAPNNPYDRTKQYNVSNATLDFTLDSADAVTKAAIYATNATVIGLHTLAGNVFGTNSAMDDVAIDSGILLPSGNWITGSWTLGAVSVRASLSSASNNVFLVPSGSTFGGTAAVTLPANTSLRVLGTLNKPVICGGQINGTGTIGGSVQFAGFGTSLAEIQAGSFVGSTNTATMTTGGLAFGASSGLRFAIKGTNASQLNVVGGGVELGSAVAALTLTGPPVSAATNTTFVLINNDGADPITGRFAGLANDGDAFVYHTASFDYTFAVNYEYDAAGDGGNNDLAVTYLSFAATPEPGALLIPAVAGAAGLCGRRRWRRRRD